MFSCNLSSLLDTNRGPFMELYNINIYHIRLYLEYNQFPKNVY